MQTQKRMRLGAILGIVGMVAACSTATSETLGTLIVDGEAFDTRTRTYERASGSFVATDVRVGYTWVSCLIDSPNDCERKVREEIEFRRNAI